MSSQHSVGIQQCEATQRKLLSTACVNPYTLKGMSGTVLTTFMSIPLASLFWFIFFVCLRTSVKWYLQTQRTNIWAAKGERRGGMNWETGHDTFTLPCTKQRMNEDLLCSTGKSTRCPVVTYAGRKSKTEGI